jgi:hypothetical protein
MNQPQPQNHTETFRVSRRYRCTMSLGDGGVSTEWEPRKPSDLNKKEVRAYRRGRDGFLARALPGVKLAVVEV